MKLAGTLISVENIQFVNSAFCEKLATTGRFCAGMPFTAWRHALSPDLANLVAATSRIQTFSAGSVLASRATMASHWIGVERGLLRTCASSVEGRPYGHLLAASGEWTCESEIVRKQALLYDIVAVVKTEAILVSSTTLNTLIERDNEFARFAMLQTLISQSKFIERLHDERLLSKTALVAKVVIELFCSIRSESFEIQSCSSSVKLTQESIAEIVGLSRQTVNQVLKSLVDKKLLRTKYNSIEIDDIDALKNYLFDC